MEKEIVALKERLNQEPDWNPAWDNLDRDIIKVSYQDILLTTYAFAHEEYSTETQVLAAWYSLEVQFLQFLSDLDRSGISSILGRVGPEYLSDFSFSDAIEFREFEESLLTELEMPPEGWNRLWQIADIAVPRLLEYMREDESFTFRTMFSEIRRRFEDPSFNFEHLSPFKWSKAVAAGSAYLLALADTIVAVPTSGVGLTSLAAGLGIVIYSAG